MGLSIKILTQSSQIKSRRVAPLAHEAKVSCHKFTNEMNYPIIACDLFGSRDGLQGKQVKESIDRWEVNNPGCRQVMFRALVNARPSHLLDSELFDFPGIKKSNQENCFSNGFQVLFKR